MNFNEEKREDFTNVQDKFMNMGIYQKLSLLIGVIVGSILVFLVLLRKTVGYNKISELVSMVGAEMAFLILGGILILTGAINLA